GAVSSTGGLGPDVRTSWPVLTDPGSLVVLPSRHHLCVHHPNRPDRPGHGSAAARGGAPPGGLAGAHRMTAPLSDVRISFRNVAVDYPTADGPMRVLDGIDLDIRQDRKSVV